MAGWVLNHHLNKLLAFGIARESNLPAAAAAAALPEAAAAAAALPAAAVDKHMTRQGQCMKPSVRI